MTYRGIQWEVTRTSVRRIDDEGRFEFPLSQLATVEDYGWGPVYSWFTHLADTKDGFDVDDFTSAFRAAWAAGKFGLLDDAVLSRGISQAESFVRR